jgi:hypothetical protein
MRDLDQEIWSPEFLITARLAVRRAIADMGDRCPVLAEHTAKWLALRCDLNRPEDYFTEPQSVPLLALPWWLEHSIRGEVDADFQADLMYSTISGYYFTRMLDDIMDGHQIDRAVLPALYPFHAQFLGTYFRYFPATDPFWKEFERILRTTVEAVAVEATLKDIGAAQFVGVSARKPAAAVIPLAAVCRHYCRSDLLPPWEEFFSLFGKWHQMSDDLADWSSDYESGNRTWLLSEAERRCADHESVPVWMGREGFRWVKVVMESWINDAVIAAATLNSPELVRYLDLRRNSFLRHIDRLLNSADAWAKLLQLDIPHPHS